MPLARARKTKVRTGSSWEMGLVLEASLFGVGIVAFQPNIMVRGSKVGEVVSW